MDDDESFAWPGDEERDRDSTDDEDVQTAASEGAPTIDSAASEPEGIDEATSVGASDATPEASSEETVEPETLIVPSVVFACLKVINSPSADCLLMNIVEALEAPSVLQTPR